MNHNEKLVDNSIVERLIEGSFETLIERVDAAVRENLNLFSTNDEGDVHSWTYPSHVIVVNENAEFFRAEYSIGESGIEFGKVERCDVPAKEAKDLGSEARKYADDVVEAVFSGDDDVAYEKFDALFRLVASGVRITAESVEDDLANANISDSEWLEAVTDHAVSMREFVGSASNMELPKPKFEALINADELSEDDEERYRKIVGGALRALRSRLEDLNDGIAVARQVDEGYTFHDDEEAAKVNFIEFSQQLGKDLDAMIGLVEDAIAVSGDGSLRSLARIHDSVASIMADAGLASAFAEKFSTKFTAPEAA